LADNHKDLELAADIREINLTRLLTYRNFWRRFRDMALTILIVVLAACGAQVDEPLSASITKTDMPGIVNFSRSEESTGFAGSPVGFGGVTSSAVMPVLKNEGFATVINLRLAAETGADVQGGRAAAEAAGMNYIHLPLDPKKLDTAFVSEFMAAVGDVKNQPVYIHCGSATRVAALWMIGRVLNDGLAIDAASKEAGMIAAKPDSAVSMATRYITSQGQ
jgi:uncharacterized protein (TIGR01244 family)